MHIYIYTYIHTYIYTPCRVGLSSNGKGKVYQRPIDKKDLDEALRSPHLKKQP